MQGYQRRREGFTIFGNALEVLLSGPHYALYSGHYQLYAVSIWEYGPMNVVHLCATVI
jgi:hypothetical protein